MWFLRSHHISQFSILIDKNDELIRIVIVTNDAFGNNLFLHRWRVQEKSTVSYAESLLSRLRFVMSLLSPIRVSGASYVRYNVFPSIECAHVLPSSKVTLLPYTYQHEAAKLHVYRTMLKKSIKRNFSSRYLFHILNSIYWFVLIKENYK